MPLRERARLRLAHAVQRDHRAAELRRRQPGEEIALVFFVRRALQKRAAVFQRDLGIMPGRDLVEAVFKRPVQHHAEFDRLIAEKAGVRRFARAVRTYKRADHIFFKRCGKIRREMRDAELCADGGGVCNFPFHRRSLLAAQNMPGLQAHCDAGDIVPGLQKQQRGDRAIHAAAHPHQNARAAPVIRRGALHFRPSPPAPAPSPSPGAPQPARRARPPRPRLQAPPARSRRLRAAARTRARRRA